MAEVTVVKPRTERIQPGIWRLKLPCPWPGVPHGNAWAVQRGAGIVLFDTGVGGRGRLRMLDVALAQSGFGVADIELVVCTHCPLRPLRARRIDLRGDRLRAVDASEVGAHPASRPTIPRRRSRRASRWGG